MPSVKKRVVGLPLLPAFPKASAHRPPAVLPAPTLIGMVPSKAPVSGSKALISLATKLKFPTNRSPLNGPKPVDGASATPQGEASLLPLIKLHSSAALGGRDVGRTPR